MNAIWENWYKSLSRWVDWWWWSGFISYFQYIYMFPFLLRNQLKWSWDSYPSCFLPKSLRGSEIKYIDVNTLHTCLDSISDEEQDAASTSHNFLERGKYIIIIIPIYIICSIFLMLVGCGVGTSSLLWSYSSSFYGSLWNNLGGKFTLERGEPFKKLISSYNAANWSSSFYKHAGGFIQNIESYLTPFRKSTTPWFPSVYTFP